MQRHRIARAIGCQCQRPLLVIGLVGMLTLGACTDAGSVKSETRPPPGSQLPTVSGRLLRPLWQRPLYGGYVVDGGLVLAPSFPGPAGVDAVSAATGSTVWTAKPPRRLLVMGLVPGNGIVLIEAGHFSQTRSGDDPDVTSAIALDIRTGRHLWTAKVAGRRSLTPPIAVSGDVVLIGDRHGAITARQATTGRVLWHRQPPPDCPRVSGYSPLASALAADNTQAAASFECAGRRVLVQMLDPGTGAMSWSWESPQEAAGTQADFGVAGVASEGDIVLLAGQDAPRESAHRLARTVPRTYSWPDSLGEPGGIEVALALDARTGRSRWIELGGQSVTFTLADGAVCETVNTGMECRDDITGALTSPVLVTGQSGMPSLAGDGSAGISGSIAAVAVAPFRVGSVRVEVIPIRGDRPLGQAEVSTGISPANANHATLQPFIVAADTLPGGRTLLLLRRVDLPSSPVVALEVVG